LYDSPKLPDVILIGTGSEIVICVDAAKQLESQGTSVRIVSLPCWELFDEQPLAYQQEVLPMAVRARVAVEAGIAQGWEKYIGSSGKFVGMTGFGASAPFEELYQHFKITPAAVVEAALASIKASS
jgi:transketolase